ncbi:MAG: tRNA (adenosine(37)-N6)-threonylcarbamoyltransferase complex dimerization subunit type 1 TsaB [candidate division NC10 bacterium]|nr:tRNA (adenosine(37)-N6)-threonylcarbamoyltransferase complex dimerization subunit type 1 TsaB [candidate division NC10 bacterium]
MIVLGINTSTLEGSVALMSDRGLISEYFLNVESTHSERLLPSIDLLLREGRLQFQDLSGIAVAIGPGSFTGLRIGLASAKGLALASSLPLLGIPTLEAMARNLPFCRYPICPMLNARKGEVYWALYRFEQGNLMQVEAGGASLPGEVAKRIQGETVFLGDGAVEYGEQIRRILKEKALFAPIALRNARASVVAEMGMERLRRGERDDPATLVPQYMRRSEAEIKWGMKIED